MCLVKLRNLKTNKLAGEVSKQRGDDQPLKHSLSSICQYIFFKTLPHVAPHLNVGLI